MSRWTLSAPTLPAASQVDSSLREKWWNAHSQRHHMWLAARRLGGYPELEWTFSINVMRCLKYYERPRGSQMVYEPLEDFDDAKEATTLNALLQAGGADPWLVIGVQLGMKTYESAFTAPRGRLRRPTEGDEFVGLHSVVTQYGGSDDQLGFWNSWGAWGDQGRGSMERAYFKKYVNECWVWRSGEVGPPGALRLARRSRDLPALVSAWTTPVKSQEAISDLDGRRLSFHRYRLQSLTTGGDIEVVDVRDMRGQRIGWLHLHHIHWESPQRSVISELFVWPDYRRRGLASALWEDARALAAEQGSAVLQLFVSEADGLPRLLPSVFAFARSCGVDLEPVATTRLPALAAIGSHTLR